MEFEIRYKVKLEPEPRPKGREVGGESRSDRCTVRLRAATAATADATDATDAIDATQAAKAGPSPKRYSALIKWDTASLIGPTADKARIMIG